MPLGSSLVDWRYDEAKVQGRLWTPAQFPASFLSAWYDFSAIETLTLDGSTKVSQVNDLSGNGNFAAQATAGLRPTFFPTGKVNVTPRMYATVVGGSIAMILNSSLAYSAGSGISIAIAANNVGLANCALCGGTTGALEFAIGTGGTDVRLLRRGVVELAASSNVTAAGGMCVLGCDTQTNVSAVWLNGVRTGNTNDPGFTNPITNIFDSAGDTFSGGIGEMLFLNGGVLTTLQRNLVDGYLAWKWGCVQKLTATHPFLTRPPLIGDSLRIRQPFLAVVSTPAATIAASGSLMPMMGVG